MKQNNNHPKPKRAGSTNFDLAAISLNYSIEEIFSAFRNPVKENFRDIQSAYFHEQYHWFQAISTSWGYFRLRKNPEIKEHIARSIYALKKAQPNIRLGIPFVPWIQSESRYKRSPYKETLGLGIDVSGVLIDFHSLLNGSEQCELPLSKGKYIELFLIAMTQGEVYLPSDIRNDLMNYWHECISDATYEMKDGSWVLPIPGFKTGSIFGAKQLLESCARLIEYGFLFQHYNVFDLTQDQLINDIAKRKFGDYTIANDLFEENIRWGETENNVRVNTFTKYLFLIACDIALNAPFHSLHWRIILDEKLSWANLHPGFRFAKVVKEINRIRPEKIFEIIKKKINKNPNKYLTSYSDIIHDLKSHNYSPYIERILNEEARLGLGKDRHSLSFLNANALNMIVEETEKELCDRLNWTTPSEIASHVVSIAETQKFGNTFEEKGDFINKQYASCCGYRMNNPGVILNPFSQIYIRDAFDFHAPFILVNNSLWERFPYGHDMRDGIYWDPEDREKRINFVAKNDFVFQNTYNYPPISLDNLKIDFEIFFVNRLIEVYQNEFGLKDVDFQHLRELKREMEEHNKTIDNDREEVLKFLYWDTLGLEYENLYYMI